MAYGTYMYYHFLKTILQGVRCAQQLMEYGRYNNGHMRAHACKIPFKNCNNTSTLLEVMFRENTE